MTSSEDDVVTSRQTLRALARNSVNETSVDAAGPSTLPFPVVGIGASAGGLRSLMDFFGAVRGDAGMAFVVISHMSPDHESGLPDVLQKATPMKVVQVRERVAIKPNTVYVISPRSNLAMHDGHLDPRSSAGLPREMTIDRFLETLGESHGRQAFAVVMSGTGSDGTNGLKAVKAAGGVTFAQEPAEAEYDSMPRNAIGSGGVDFVLSAADMPEKMGALWSNTQSIELPELEDRPTPEDVVARAEDALREILVVVRARTGHDFSQYKRATLLRRLERRLQVNQLRDLPTYRDLIRENPGESRLLLRDLLISVTAFFRDPQTFEALEKQVIPGLFQGKEHGGKIRAWVAGCASGEEAYSVAMLIAEHAQRISAPVEINVFATDIDEEALQVARTAFYPESIREQVSAERLRRFFTSEHGGYRVQKSLREMVMFATHNVIQDAPFSRLDLISCRNLLIYLNRHVQEKVLDLLHFSLRPEGHLLLGLSESVDDSNDGFAVVDKTHRIYRQQPRARVGMILNALPTLAPVQLSGNMSAAASRRLVSYGEVHQSLLEHYAPPSIVVDDRYEIVHLSEHAGRFLQLGGGEPSMNLLRVVPEGLRLPVRSGLDQAMQTMRTVERLDVAMQRGPQLVRLSIKVHPVREKASGRAFALVVFDESQEAGQRPPADQPAADPGADALETRLLDTQAQLRAAVEQYEIQNEELKASNEELQATNEELRAASEELETGKEELQSINEELTTVNQELKNKVDEATRISDDLQNFITSTEIAVLFVDRDLRLMRFTPFAREIFNVIPTDVGRPLLDVTHRLENAELEPDIVSVLQTLRVVEREVRASSGRWYILRILPYRTTEDRIGGAVLTFIDITQRKEAEQQVQQHRSWLQLVVDSVADYAIMTLDGDGRIKSWNSGAEKIFGYSAEEVINSGFELIFTEEERDAGVPAQELHCALETGRANDDRWQRRKDGSRFFASGVTAPLADGADAGFVKLLRDLTEQRIETQRRDELLVAEQSHRAMIEEAMRLKDEFLATLSHELRNPLALILMQSELLQRAKELQKYPKLRNAVDVINRMVRAQSHFVEDMLDVSRARTGKLAIERQLVPLPYLIADSIGALSREADENEIVLDVRIGEDPLIVAADAVRVRQIAWNLLSNAVKFTPRRGTVSVELARDGNEARFVVEDSGIGIEPDQLPKIFDWFRQGEAGTKRIRGGLGIGLALVKQLVELQGGRVKAESDGPGKGARFTVWLPLQQSGAPRVLNTGPVSATPGERLKGMRVLVIDDAQANAEALAELLRFEGADATAESNAAAAVERARAEPYDVIVSDLAMPKMDGYEMLQQIRAGTLNAATPAIAYSGYGGPEEAARSKAAGFDLHITKPVDLPRMLDAIDALRPGADGRKTA
jgi:two-component system CheB/CheR fusion protein